MKKWIIPFILFISLVTAQHALAEIKIKHGWIRATPPSAKMSAAYMMIENTGDQADRLIAASSPICEVTEIHTVIKENGMMKMRPVEFIEIPAKGMVKLKMGGYHVMFIRLKQQPKPNQEFPVQLQFEKAGKLDLVLPVKKSKKKMMKH